MNDNDYDDDDEEKKKKKRANKHSFNIIKSFKSEIKT